MLLLVLSTTAISSRSLSERECPDCECGPDLDLVTPAEEGVDGCPVCVCKISPPTSRAGRGEDDFTPTTHTVDTRKSFQSAVMEV